MTRARIAVLASGTGTNLQAILDYFDRLGERRAGEVVLVASDRAQAGALARARARGIAAEAIAPTSAMKERATLSALIDAQSPDFIVLAGYLRLVPLEVVRRYAGRMLNVHPALLPAFGGAGMYGRRVHEAVLDAGVKVTGVTAHFVDEEYDRGTIIAQWPVAVRAGDDADTLAARVLRVEHLLFPRVVDAVARGRVTLASCREGRAFVDDENLSFSLLPQEDACLAENMDRALGC
jgi:formyltetrahydrofolate-dependent phosphoribosylglycinamide formyltransferase